MVIFLKIQGEIIPIPIYYSNALHGILFSSFPIEATRQAYGEINRRLGLLIMHNKSVVVGQISHLS